MTYTEAMAVLRAYRPEGKPRGMHPFADCIEVSGGEYIQALDDVEAVHIFLHGWTPSAPKMPERPRAVLLRLVKGGDGR